MKRMLELLSCGTGEVPLTLYRMLEEGVLVSKTIREASLLFHSSERYCLSATARDNFGHAQSSLQVIQIEAGKPHTAHLEIATLLSSLRGDVRVCDPYYGGGSLLRLSELKSCSTVKFLTREPGTEEAAVIATAIKEYVKEHPTHEVCKETGKDLHDRYVVTTDRLIILGHGLKDIGNKESFVVSLDRSYAADAIDSTIAAFDKKWKAATKLP